MTWVTRVAVLHSVRSCRPRALPSGSSVPVCSLVPLLIPRKRLSALGARPVGALGDTAHRAGRSPALTEPCHSGRSTTETAFVTSGWQVLWRPLHSPPRKVGAGRKSLRLWPREGSLRVRVGRVQAGRGVAEEAQRRGCGEAFPAHSRPRKEQRGRGAAGRGDGGLSCVGHGQEGHE